MQKNITVLDVEFKITLIQDENLEYELFVTAVDDPNCEFDTRFQHLPSDGDIEEYIISMESSMPEGIAESMFGVKY